MPDFALENQYGKVVAGIDEVGRGPIAGPVIACAFVFVNRSNFQAQFPFINDSKKLTSNRRRVLYDFFMQQQGIGCHFAIGEASVAEIDQINIRQASLLAMQRAYDGLSISVDFALVDGNVLPSISCPAQPVIKGDQLSYSIAAASIVAKEMRDQLMCDLAQEYPYYCWERNAGYGTKKHLDGLQSHGITPHHRLSFAPVKEMIVSG